jgi:fluoride exporter
MLNRLLWIGLGGFVGASLRYLTGSMVHRMVGQASFPFGTFVVNFCGSLLIGFVITMAGSGGMLSSTAQAFLITGMLGAFTTFSTFSYETLQLFQDGETYPAVMNMMAHLVFGLTAVWLGGLLARSWSG